MLRRSEINKLDPLTCLKVVLYLRMSGAQQEDSPLQQRKQCRAYAERRGWEVVGEYLDDAKSGSKDTHKRVQFHKMIADAKEGGFNAILCWNTSRFGRLDSIESGQYKNSLRQAGV